MPPASRDLTIYRGDIYSHQLTFENDATPPAALDVHTYTFTAQIRDRRDRATGTPAASFTVDATQAASGIIVLSLSETDTAALTGSLYYWDLQVEPIGQTWLAGTVTVSGDVTHA
jgi:PKD repeat protein